MPAKPFHDSQQWPARRCCGACDQGRRECQCPQACEQPEPQRTALDGWLSFAALLASAALVVLSIALLAAHLSH